MAKEILYNQLAKYYDYVYHDKPYAEEAETVSRLISRYKKADGNTLLEVACGTGNYLAHFKKEYECTGFDISQDMLAIASEKVPGVRLLCADMTLMDLGEEFDAVACLFSSIGYLKTYSKLSKALDRFSTHLKTGGVLVVDPWFTLAEYNVGAPHMIHYDSKDLKISRHNISEIRGNVSVMDMHYLISERGKETTHFTDHHELGLFEVDKTLQLMRDAGLMPKHLTPGLRRGRGIYVAVKE